MTAEAVVVSHERMHPRTCEWCRWWHARVGGFGRVTVVCLCEGGPREHVLTGAAEACGSYEPRIQRIEEIA